MGMSVILDLSGSSESKTTFKPSIVATCIKAQRLVETTTTSLMHSQTFNLHLPNGWNQMSHATKLAQ